MHCPFLFLHVHDVAFVPIQCCICFGKLHYILVNQFRITALIRAALKARVAAVQVLVEAGANMNLQDMVCLS